MIVLDTNVISEVLAPAPDSGVMGWLSRQDPLALRLSVVTVAEIAHGITLLPDGARRTALARAWDGLHAAWGERILRIGPLEAEAAGIAMAARKKAGRPMSLGDALIAGTCLALRCTLATRNTRDFAHIGLDLVDPWRRTGPRG